MGHSEIALGSGRFERSMWREREYDKLRMDGQGGLVG
jgi:hypothetical protein